MKACVKNRSFTLNAGSGSSSPGLSEISITHYKQWKKQNFIKYDLRGYPEKQK